VRLLAEAMAGGHSRPSAVNSPRSNSDAPPVSRVTCKLAGGGSLALSAAEITLESLIAVLEEVLREARKARPQG
jgi:hypothetical protein